MNMKRSMSKTKEQGHQIKSYLELYFKHGSLPSKHVNLNSKALDEKHNKKEFKNYEDYIELEKPVKGTKVILKEKLLKIQDLSTDLSINILDQFEEISSANDWNDEQMALIFHGIIVDEAKIQLPKDSYLKLRKSLLDILYSSDKKRYIMRRIDKTSQTNFSTIKEYKNEIENLLTGYTHVYNLKKSERKTKFEEVFIKGLGDYTHLELTKLNVINNEVNYIFEYLYQLECELIANGSKIKSQQQTITGNPKSETNKKWCSLHKLNYSHDTRNCNTLKNKTKKCALNEAINKNLIIQETSQEIKDVNDIASRKMIIKDYIKEKEQNILNKNVKEKLNETFIYKASEDRHVEVDETEEIKINTKDTQQKPLIKNQKNQELLSETKLLIMKEEQIPTKHVDVLNKINIYETEVKNEHTNIRLTTVKNDSHNIKLKLPKTKTYRHCKTTNNKNLVKLNHLKYNNNKERDLMKKPDKDKTTRKLYKKIFRKKVKLKLFRKYVKTKRKKENLRTDEIIKSEFRPPPIKKRSKIINFDQNNNNQLISVLNRSREEIISQA
ncbi:hypothetical protein NAPIS_ORF00927 [Vairimorpha apis BRL 01]|uniref:Uncharacterized protein n=1 Tax=Vairimorpha apis BRL 01 TaxID=1037528 RepID=T0MKL4_9MICR|nr:hypothetical protein NAPIS_ORF00927 [Vairimorpha apis BRL 01]